MKKHLAAVAALTCSLAALSTAPAGAQAGAGKLGKSSLATLLAADGQKLDSNWNDFDIVEAAAYAVIAAKPNTPVAVLADGKTALTAFIPTDRAFRKLAKQLTGSKPATEKATVKAIMKAADIDTLESILLYHVVPGATITAKMAAKSDGAALSTAQGGDITVDVRKRGIFLRDLDPNAGNPKVVVVDLNAGNRQIAHGINKVLRPIDL